MLWTKEQRDAIDRRNTSILCSASAGCGKTAVLTERVCSLIAGHEAAADEMLVLTFTKDAAREMRERIQKRLESLRLEEAQKSGINERQIEYLSRQASLLAGADITTIDAFCLRLLHEYYYVAGLPENCGTLSEFNAILMKNQVLADLLKEKASRPGVGRHMIEYFGGLEKTKDEILSLCAKTGGLDDAETWIQHTRENYSNPRPLLEGICVRQVQQACEDLVRAGENILNLNDPFGGAPRSTLDAQMAAAIHLLDELKVSGADAVADGLPDIFTKATRLPSKKGSPLIGKEEFDEARKQLAGMTNLPGLLNEQERRMKAMSPVLEEVLNTAAEFESRFAAQKQQQSLVDYADMEKYARKVLEDPNVLKELQDKYRFVFIDEYQDTSPLQEKIVTTIATDSNLFCVGDVKQSIYQFRSADPSLFLKRTREYESGKGGAFIPLNTNFRSAQNVLDCANDVFRYLSDTGAGMQYGKSQALVCGRPHGVQEATPAATTIEYIPAGLSEDDAAWMDGLSSDYLESLAVARFLEERHKQPVRDAKTGEIREACWSDFAILARSRTGFNRQLLQVLRDKGIPCDLDRSGSLPDALEIRLLVQILTLASGKHDDTAVLAVLHNGFFGFTDSDLLAVRKYNPEDYLEKNLRDIAEDSEQDERLREKCQRFVRFFERTTQMSAIDTPAKVIEYVIDTLHYRNFCIAMGNGRQRMANLEELLSHAREFFRDGSCRLRAFVSAFGSVKTEDKLKAGRMEENTDKVQMVTIHGSKGLQYPIVVLPFTGQDLDKGGTQSSGMVLHNELGIGLRYQDFEWPLSGELLWTNTLKQANKDSETEEKMRLLYVAMTRAQEEVHIVGSQVGTFSETAGYKNKEFTGRSYLNWITAAAQNGDTDGIWQMEKIDADILESAPEAADGKRLITSSLQMPSEQLSRHARKFHLAPDSVSASQAAIKEDEDSFFAVKRTRDRSRPEENRAFDQEAAAKGTQVHSMLEQADFTRMGDMDYIQQLAESHGLSDEADNIYRLFQSDFGRLIMSADQIVREKEAVAVVPYTMIDPSSTDQRMVRVPCIIDLMFRNGDKWYLVDWKTDSLHPENSRGLESRIQERMRHHALQLRLYEKAMESCFQIHPDEIRIGFTGIGRFVPLGETDPEESEGAGEQTIVTDTDTSCESPVPTEDTSDEENHSSLTETREETAKEAAPVDNSADTEEFFFIKVRSGAANASAFFGPNKFTVRKGSVIQPGSGGYSAEQLRLIEDGQIVNDCFVQDTEFTSPSSAARACLGYNVSGWEVWKTADGKKLKMVRTSSRKSSSRNSQNHQDSQSSVPGSANPDDVPESIEF